MCSDRVQDIEQVVGVTGKIPSMSDYLERGLPGRFSHAWANWLDQVMVAGSALFGADWKQRFGLSPVWRFALPAGCIGPLAWTGVMLPSSDGLGRIYPLTLAIGTLLDGLIPWSEAELRRAEDIGLALADAVIGLDEAVAQLGAIVPCVTDPAASDLPPAYRWWAYGVPAHALLQTAAGSVSGALPDALAGIVAAAASGPVVGSAGGVRFWHGAWGDKPATRLITPGLPPPRAFASLADSDPVRQGWNVVEGAER